MSADLLRRAADRLEDPALCNTNPWDKPLAALLRAEALKHAEVESLLGGFGLPVYDTPADTVARAILGADS